VDLSGSEAPVATDGPIAEFIIKPDKYHVKEDREDGKSFRNE
jgi:hypothetical protein